MKLIENVKKIETVLSQMETGFVDLSNKGSSLNHLSFLTTLYKRKQIPQSFIIKEVQKQSSQKKSVVDLDDCNVFVSLSCQTYINQVFNTFFNFSKQLGQLVDLLDGVQTSCSEVGCLNDTLLETTNTQLPSRSESLDIINTLSLFSMKDLFTSMEKGCRYGLSFEEAYWASINQHTQSLHISVEEAMLVDHVKSSQKSFYDKGWITTDLLLSFNKEISKINDYLKEYTKHTSKADYLAMSVSVQNGLDKSFTDGKKSPINHINGTMSFLLNWVKRLTQMELDYCVGIMDLEK